MESELNPLDVIGRLQFALQLYPNPLMPKPVEELLQDSLKVIETLTKAGVKNG
jgi:hypothetical protein